MGTAAPILVVGIGAALCALGTAYEYRMEVRAWARKMRRLVRLNR